MANLVRLRGDRVELPFQAQQYPLTPATPKLQAALGAFQTLERDGSLHGLPLAERHEVTRFLYQFGHLLYRTLFPQGPPARLDAGAPLLLELHGQWSAYPWELLNDGYQWLALAHGVMRYAYQPVRMPVQPVPRPLRVLGVSALPLPPGAGSRVARDAEQLGTRFVASLPHLADAEVQPRLPFEQCLLEHATPDALEAALGRHPHALLFSGFASEEGWFLQNAHGAPQCVSWDWLLQRLREAAGRGLRLVVLADSLGMLQPETAAQRTRDVLRAGVPAVIRVEGHIGRERLQGYLRALFGALAGGTAGSTVEAAHQAALRGLFREHEEAWEWSFLRLYPQGISIPDAAPAAPALALESESAPGPLLDFTTAVEMFASPPAPPALRERRRCFNRSGQQRLLMDALCSEQPAPSPLVLLSGPAGSGKTHLALEVARRAQRQFAEVLYLPQRALLPDATQVLPLQGLAEPEPAPGQWLLNALAAQVGARGAGAAVAPLGGTEARAALARRLGDGAHRLLILDRWERMEGYDAFCEALQELPAACRVLLISRSKPPLVRGTPMELSGLSGDELAHVFGTHLQERLRALGDGGALEAVCREDLLLARLLRHAPRLPDRSVLGPALASAQDSEGMRVAAGELLRWLAQRTLPMLSADARAVLPVLAFCPWLAHRDLLAAGADLDAPRLEAALAELQWLGWVDSFDGGRYAALHARLHPLLIERVLLPGALVGLRSRLLREYRRYLADTAAALRQVPPRWLREAPPLLAWSDAHGATVPADWTRRLHRLAVERVNLAELALLLADEEEWRTLERLAADAAPLSALPELEPATALLHRAVLVAGERQHDAALQAGALNRLAAPLVEADRPDAATPLLERAQALLRDTADPKALGETQCLLSRCYELTGRLDAAEALLHATTELAQQVGDGALLARCGQALARIWSRRASVPAEGAPLLSRLATYLRQNDRPLDAALIARAQGDLMLREGRVDDARQRFEEVLQACRTAEHALESARTLLRLADCHIAEGDPAGALALLSDAASCAAVTASDLEEQGRLLSEVCRLFEQRAELPQALEAYLRIRGVLEQIGDREALVGVLDRIGGLYFQLGEQTKSTRCYEERLHLQATLAAS